MGQLNPYVTQKAYDKMLRMIYEKTTAARKKQLKQIARDMNERSDIKIIDKRRG
ncbi:hypothetical protein FC18_GL000625 [Lacticaseibacillus sharpeae JCM 1186 = DSM 20505]|uniref:Uncharacterized protein n=1 Tax=Lacticaseibacillus sharpeae JCM 1186 = DSM 20505 TaxID=1291052 RepID=A0A0R1ZU02_9LACO|nr:hypothetical protein FC18_GL000625 [Lacticaseibacillus sharpeae JCM 1186 = DSM 20505]